MKISQIQKQILESRKSRIKSLFTYRPTHERTCQELTRHFIERDMLSGSVAHYLSGSISSILHKLVKEGFLEYSTEKTPRGGHIYKLKT